MKTSRFTEEQNAFAIKQHEMGTRVEEICRKMGISDATFYKWRQKYAGLGPSELKKLKQLEEENSKLKRLVRGQGKRCVSDSPEGLPRNTFVPTPISGTARPAGRFRQ